ncbi:MAG: glycosyltransferase family 4 protein [Methanomicrobiaceae archaeon]|nr:glycosyltransferase family 4 protein [Methanomicrobiaceae archaeon]MDD5418627.1 glycosyltransferase family 4 protein [Methanomicrobiaceae archaeon]
MKILAIPTTVGLSKPRSGGQNRFSNLLKVQKKENDVVVLEPEHLWDEQDRAIAEVYTYRDLDLFSRKLSIFRDLNLDFMRKAYAALKHDQIDIIQITHPSGALALKALTLLAGKRIPIVYDAHNIESDFTRQTFADNQYYSKIERLIIPIYVAALERVACKHIFTHITSVSATDAEELRTRYHLHPDRICVVPSGCYLPDQGYGRDKRALKAELGIDAEKTMVFFHGLYSHPPNRAAFDLIEHEIAPRFSASQNVQFVIGGTQVPEFERGNVRSLGFLENIYSISAADIAIVPLTTGGGTKLKIFDYMSVGLPIVTTEKGIEGIEAENYEHAIIVDGTGDEFIDAIRYLIENENERRRIGANARGLAEEKYNWDTIGENLTRIYRDIIERELQPS